MPRKVRELLHDLKSAGFTEVAGGGKGSHWKLTHPAYPGAVTISGQLGDDAKPYQEKHVQRALETVHEAS
ncbi:MAG: type II toxin-antitoxin system HicA family toxin [Planctomycetaceae bacterium]